MWIVTGGTGFIGSQMIRNLNQTGATNIIAVDLIEPKSRASTLKDVKFKAFISAFEFLEALDRKPSEFNSVNGVIHLGANSSTIENDWELLKKLNLEYSKKIWSFCTHYKIPLVYASSAATYGGGEKGYSDSLRPQDLKTLNLYGESKRLFDQWALEQTLTPPLWYGLKFFNVYGPGEYHKEEMASLVFKAFHQITSSGVLKLFKSHHPDYKDGEQKRDFVYVKDVTRWILELFQRKPQSGIYNMGYGQAQSWNDLAQAIFKALNKSEKIVYIDIPAHIRDQYQYFTEATTMKWAAAGLTKPDWDIEKGVNNYLNHYLKRVT